MASNSSKSLFPPHPNVVYVFDVDGTLTPHPGDDQNSLWYLQEDYINILSEDQINRMARLVTQLPSQIILISRNQETEIMNFFTGVDPMFPHRVDPKWSSFRRSGRAPTIRSKCDAFRELHHLDAHIIYIDDSASEIERFAQTSELNGRSLPIKIDAWLGDDATYDQVLTMIHTYLLHLK